MKKTAAKTGLHLNFKIAVVLFFLGLACYISAFIAAPFSSLAAMILNLIATILAGYTVILEGVVDTIKVSIKRRGFFPNIHILMALGAVGAIIIQEYSEAALLILIFAAAHFLEEYAEARSKKEISSLIKLNPTKARRLNPDGTIELVETNSLRLNDVLKVLNGDQVPTDGIILSGNTTINQASITGESMPVDKKEGDEVFGATINGDGTFTMRVTKNNEDTVFSKILQLVNEAQTNVSKTAAFIKKIEPFYVIAVLLIAPLFYLAGIYLLGWPQTDSFYHTMVFLIGASPCALAVADIPATLASISNLAKRGVLFKGGNYLSNLNDLRAIAFDKTGTLTHGQPQVTDVYFAKKIRDHEPKVSQVIFSMEQKSNHPLAKAIINHFNQYDLLDFEVTNTLGVGLSASYENEAYAIGKPSSFGELNEEIRTVRSQYEEEGKTVVLVSMNQEVVAVIALLDEEKPCAKTAIDYFNNQGIRTVLITGDSHKTGQAIGKKLGISEVRSDILPQEKAEIIIGLKKQYKTVAMIGDGVNDAPALVHADIGIAMGEGTDIAIEVSDVVLMKNDLNKIIYTHKVAKKLRRIVLQNIIFAMAIVLFLMITNVFDVINNMSIAVTIHEGSTVLVLLNGLRMLGKVK